MQGDGRRGISGPSPSYLGSEPSAGNSMAGGAGTAPAPSPSASRSRVPELPPSIARRARAAAQPARPPASELSHHLPPSQWNLPPDPEVAPHEAKDPRRWRGRVLQQAPPLSGSAGEKMGGSGAGALVGWSSGCSP